MPLKVLVDENLPLRVSSFLRSHGFEAIDVREAGLRGASDEEILGWAKTHGFLILTEDLGFGSVIRLPEDHTGVMVVRGCSGLSMESLLNVILRCLRAVLNIQHTGRIFICEPGRIRIGGSRVKAESPQK